VFTNCVDEHHELRYEGMVPHGHYCVPIVDGDELIGVLNLYVEHDHQKTVDEERFLAAVANVLAGVVKRKRAEWALRKSEERFELAVRGTDAGIWDWDLRTNQVYYSPLWKRMLGYEEHEIQDEYAAWERLVHPDVATCRCTKHQGMLGETGYGKQGFAPTEVQKSGPRGSANGALVWRKEAVPKRHALNRPAPERDATLLHPEGNKKRAPAIAITGALCGVVLG
jgi:PAS domain-containing protein